MMFSTALRGPATAHRVTAGQTAILAFGGVGAWAALLLGAPYWVPRAGARADRFFDRMGDRFERLQERLPKTRKPLGIRIPVPRFGSVAV